MTDTSDIKQTYENMFSHRFTEQDAEYQEYLKMPESQPPVVEDWRGGNQRNQDRMTDTSDIKQTYENMFSHRFTEQDAEYQEYLKMPESQPPVVEDWRGGNQRNQDRYRDNRHQRGWEGRRDNSYNQQRDGKGWGNNHNQYRQERSYHQGGGYRNYQSGSERFHPDRY